MKSTILLVCSLLVVTTLFYACDKDENNFSELSRLADLKLQEAVKLTENQPCRPAEEWRIDTLYYRYVPVHPSFEKAYNVLIQEYRRLLEQADRAYRPGKDGPMVYNTSLVELPPHFGVRCKEGKMIVASALDLELSEINERLEVLFPEVRDFFKERPCTDVNQWGVLTIRKDCEFVPIAITTTADFRVFTAKERAYSHLNYAKMHLAEVKGCPTVNPNPPKGVVCKDGKASVSY